MVSVNGQCGAETELWKGIVEENCSVHGSQGAEKSKELERRIHSLQGHIHSDPPLTDFPSNSTSS